MQKRIVCATCVCRWAAARPPAPSSFQKRQSPHTCTKTNTGLHTHYYSLTHVIILVSNEHFFSKKISKFWRILNQNFSLYRNKASLSMNSPFTFCNFEKKCEKMHVSGCTSHLDKYLSPVTRLIRRTSSGSGIINHEIKLRLPNKCFLSFKKFPK